MSSLLKYKAILQIPKGVLVKRIFKKIGKLFSNPEKKYLNKEFRVDAPADFHFHCWDNLSEVSKDYPEQVIDNYLNHRFDVLGSGWISTNIGADVLGIKGIKYNSTRKCVLESHALRTKELSNRISKHYKPIDWQLDHRSGFRFDEAELHSKQMQLIAGKVGVEVKVAWDKSRLQHLPQLAIQAQTKDFGVLYEEFRNVVLDFYANNPIGMGVCWSCSMDVGIRISNVILAYQIFHSHPDFAVDKDFDDILRAFAYQHGEFLESHLEQKEGLANNHYLFNLAGLLFVGLSFKGTYTKKWTSFASAELRKEFDKQFFEDGGNFEGSSHYHVFGSEVMTWSCALMLRNGWKPKAPFLAKFSKIFNLTKDLTFNKGIIPQLGDFDSGRFFNLEPNFEQLTNKEAESKYENLDGYSTMFNSEEHYFDEDLRNRNDVKSALKSITGEGDQSLTAWIINWLAYGNYLRLPNSNVTEVRNTPVTELAYNNTKEYPSNGVNLLDGLKITFYKETGLVFMTSKSLYVVINGMTNENMHHSWGHVHNDKLGLDLVINGEPILEDPGSYAYTSFNKERLAFRSTKAHNTLVSKEEQNRWPFGSLSTFYLLRDSKCEIVEITESSATLELQFRGTIQRRKVSVFEDKIVIDDASNKPFTSNFNTFGKFSNGYGKLLRTT